MGSRRKFDKNTAKKAAYILGITVCAFLLIAMELGDRIFAFARTIADFIKGCFGISGYGILAGLIVLFSFLLAGKKVVIKTKYAVNFAFLYFIAVLLLQQITSSIYLVGADKNLVSYSSYLSLCYNFSSTPSFGGLFAGVFVYPLASLSFVFSYIFLIVALMVTIFFATNYFWSIVKTNLAVNEGARQRNTSRASTTEMPSDSTIPVEDRDSKYQQSMQTLYGDVFPNNKVEEKPTANKKESQNVQPNEDNNKLERKEKNFLDLFAPKNETKKYDVAPVSSLDVDELPVKQGEQSQTSTTNVSADKPDNSEDKASPMGKLYSSDGKSRAFDEGTTNLNRNRSFPSSPNSAPIIDADAVSEKIRKDKQVPQQSVAPQQQQGQFDQQSIEDQTVAQSDEIDEQNDNITNDNATPLTEFDYAKAFAKPEPTVSISEVPFVNSYGGNAYQGVMHVDEFPHQNDAPEIHTYRPYIAPPIDLLDDVPVDKNVFEEDQEENARVLEQTLDEFKISAKVENIVTGPTVTRYELSLASGISIKKISNLTEDITRRLSAIGAVRLETTIAGKDLFGIEVPNKHTQTVTLRSVIQSEEFQKSKKGLRFALGIDIGGNYIVPDLAHMPHLLVAGSTGTGKSVCLNSLIISLMYRYSPEELRFILIDPKKVEFSFYNKSPHLMIKEVICDQEKALTSFQWAIDEMERRYTLFASIGVQDIDSYNKVIDKKTTQILPRIVMVVDELSELIMYNKNEFESKIRSLSAKARAAGIHLVLATQRPSVDIITGVIKANLPARIALRVFSTADSKTILDQGGPEKLIGKGDMLIRTDQTPKPVRLQGALITKAEVLRVLEFIRRSNEQYFDETVENKILKNNTVAGANGEGDEDQDPLFVQALEYLLQNGNGTASISMLQRRFAIGYNRAGKLIEDMVQKQYVSGFDGSKSRKLLITDEEFNKLYKNE